jgi:hypothetical protein
MRTFKQRCAGADSHTMRASFVTALGVSIVLMTGPSASARIRDAEPLPGAGCSIELTPASARVGAGEAALLNGLLTCPEPSAAAEQTITVYQHTAGSPGKEPVGEATTDSTGAFQFSSEPLEDNSAFLAHDGHARSRRTPVKVAAVITLDGPEGPALRAGRRNSRRGDAVAASVSFDGTVSPAQSGARVILQRESVGPGQLWRRIGVASVGADGTYEITHVFRRAGIATIRTLVRRHGQVPAVSEPLTYEVAPLQNPQLTLEAAPDLLSYGQPTTLSGKLQGAASGTPVVLFARAHGGALTRVGETTTGEEGTYEFSGLEPQGNTYYRVLADHQRSVVRLVVVQPSLTSEVSVSEGSATFTGSLTPPHPGEVLHLERLGANGVGYHSIAEIVMGEGDEYSLQRALEGSSKQTYRVVVPGGEGLAAIAGPLLEVQPGEEPTV